MRRPLNVLFNPAIGNPYLVGDNAGGNAPGYTYCREGCITWGSGLRYQANWMQNWNSFTGFFTSLPSAWSPPGQMEDNFAAETAAALASAADSQRLKAIPGCKAITGFFRAPPF